jgi:hypothetical protein
MTHNFVLLHEVKYTSLLHFFSPENMSVVTLWQTSNYALVSSEQQVKKWGQTSFVHFLSLLFTSLDEDQKPLLPPAILNCKARSLSTYLFTVKSFIL